MLLLPCPGCSLALRLLILLQSQAYRRTVGNSDEENNKKIICHVICCSVHWNLFLSFGRWIKLLKFVLLEKNEKPQNLRY